MISTWIIIPVKSLTRAKSRLSAILSPPERAQLMQQLLRHTLIILQNGALIGQTVVVSRDESVSRLAHQFGARSIAEAEEAGLNGAITAGVALAAANNIERVLILPADLPLLSVADVNKVLAIPRPDIVAIASDRRQDGTNALMLPPAAGFRFQYGRHSFQHHLQEAVRVALPVHIMQMPGLQFDLDTEEDWQHYLGISTNRENDHQQLTADCCL